MRHARSQLKTIVPAGLLKGLSKGVLIGGLIGVSVLLAACGQKGPLVLPSEAGSAAASSTANSTSAPSTSTPASHPAATETH